jgi:hypothetical protein
MIAPNVLMSAQEEENLMRITWLIPLAFLGLTGCVLETHTPTAPTSTTYVTPAPATAYVAPAPTTTVVRTPY